MRGLSIFSFILAGLILTQFFFAEAKSIRVTKNGVTQTFNREEYALIRDYPYILNGKIKEPEQQGMVGADGSSAFLQSEGDTLKVSLKNDEATVSFYLNGTNKGSITSCSREAFTIKTSTTEKDAKTGKDITITNTVTYKIESDVMGAGPMALVKKRHTVIQKDQGFSVTSDIVIRGNFVEEKYNVQNSKDGGSESGREVQVKFEFAGTKITKPVDAMRGPKEGTYFVDSFFEGQLMRSEFAVSTRYEHQGELLAIAIRTQDPRPLVAKEWAQRAYEIMYVPEISKPAAVANGGKGTSPTRTISGERRSAERKPGSQNP